MATGKPAVVIEIEELPSQSVSLSLSPVYHLVNLALLSNEPDRPIRSPLLWTRDAERLARCELDHLDRTSAAFERDLDADPRETVPSAVFGVEVAVDDQ